MTTIATVKDCLAKYTTATHPVNIEDLIGPEALERFLVGCSSVLFVGIATYYIKDGDATGGFGNLRRRSSLTDMTGPAGIELFHPICQRYRMDRECNGRCLKCDKEVAMKYYTGKWTGCKLYRCHLNLIDMTYPIRLNGRLLGVLFGGQIVLKSDETNWREGLQEIADGVIWDIETDSTEIPEKVSQISDICKRMKSEVPGGTKAARELIRFARDNIKDKANKRYYITLEDLVSRYKLLREFGKMIEELLSEMYEAKRRAAGEALLRAVGEYMVSGDITDEDKWSQHCRGLLEALANGDAWRVYVRRGDEYLPCSSAGGADNTSIGTKELAGAIQPDRLTRLDGSIASHRLVCDCLGVEPGRTYVFLSGGQHGRDDVSTLVVVTGSLEKTDAAMTESLSRMIASGCDRAQLAMLLGR